MSIEQPVAGQDADGRCPAEGEHLPARPSWQCRACGHPWPCERAKKALLAEYQDRPVELSLYQSACLHAAIDDLRALTVAKADGCADVFDRFLGWTRRRATSQREASPGFSARSEERSS